MIFCMAVLLIIGPGELKGSAMSESLFDVRENECLCPAGVSTVLSDTRLCCQGIDANENAKKED
jgi:hypothetical protein